MFGNIVMFGALAYASLTGADSVEDTGNDYAGMCPAAVEALQGVEDAPVEEIPAAVNAVYEADMRCAYDAPVHIVEDLESALTMCAAEDVVDTRECAEWALSEY